jgi:hypothetical protein
VVFALAKVSFPIALVVAGVAAFAVLAIITIAIFIRHRKMSHQYQLLLNSSAHNIEMEEEDNN